MKYQTISPNFFAAKAQLKITCYFHVWRYYVIARKLSWFFIGIHIIKDIIMYSVHMSAWVHARLGRRWQRIISGWKHDTRLSVCHVHTLFPTHNALLSDSTGYRVIERFHSRDQYLCKFMRTKESVYISKQSNSYGRICLEHQNGRRLIVFRTPIWPSWRHVKTL